MMSFHFTVMFNGYKFLIVSSEKIQIDYLRAISISIVGDITFMHSTW